jgi:hypothetical protein
MGTVSTLLADRVSLRCTSIDRVLLGGYIPQMQYEGGVIRFLLNRGLVIPSPVGLARNHDRLVAEYESLVAAGGIPVIRFTKGESKEEVARPYLARAKADGRTGIVLVGKAQERVGGWRGFKDPSSSRHSDRHPHFSYRRQSLFVDHWYFYVFDAEWGPTFIKTCPYAPYPVWVWCNGHEWAKQQLDAAGVGFEALDNGLRSVTDPPAAHRVCARLGAGHVRALLDRLTRLLASPLNGEDRAAGFAYDWSIRQLEVSDTAVFDRPQAGRAWFEAAIRDHLDLGRPEQVSLVVNRRVVTRGPFKTPGRFATRVITPDVDPHLQVHYKASKVKAYFKEQRALRVETTINDPGDFGVRRRLTTDNWRALRTAGVQTNARFLAALGEGEPPPPDATTLAEVVLPSTHDGLRAPGLRFGDPRVMALLASIASFSHVPGGLTNPGLCRLMTGLYRPDYNPRKATYDLRRLRRKGFIDRIPDTNTYRLTAHGRRVACLFTKVGARIVIPALTALEAPPRPRAPAPPPLAIAWRRYERELDTLIAAAS